MRYILWVVLLLEDCDVANNGLHLGFNHALEIRLNSRYNFTLVLTRGGGVGRTWWLPPPASSSPAVVSRNFQYLPGSG